VPRVPWRLLLGFALSAILVVALTRGMDPRALQEALAAADVRVLPGAILLYFVAVWVRSIRWRLLLPPGSASTPVLFRVLIVGFTANNVLPVRMGEVARAYLLARWCGLPYGTTVASLVVERVLDGLALSLFLLASLLFVPAPGYLLGVGLLVGAGFCAVAALLAFAAWNEAALASCAAWLTRPLPPGARARGSRVVAGFVRGLRLVHGTGLIVRLAALSLLGWLCELSVFLVVMLGFPLPRSLALALLAGSAANFATLVPSSPGYVGTFDGALVRVLHDVANVAPEPALAYAIVVHAALFLPVTLAGAVVLWRSRVSLGQVSRAPAPA